MLLMYSHRDLSITPVPLAGVVGICGRWMDGRVTGGLPDGLAAGGCAGGVCVAVWVGIFCIDSVVGTAILGVDIGLTTCVLLIPAVGLPFGDGGACIVATTSAHVSFAGVFFVAYIAT
jgi:hypothetical protein